MQRGISCSIASCDEQFFLENSNREMQNSLEMETVKIVSR